MFKMISLLFTVLMFTQLVFGQSGRKIPKNFPDFNEDGKVDEKDLDVFDRLTRQALNNQEMVTYSYDSASDRLSPVEGSVVRIEELNFELTIDSPCYKKCVNKDGFAGLFGKRTVLKVDRKSCLKCFGDMEIYPVKKAEICDDEKGINSEVKDLDVLSKQLPSKIKKD